MKAKRRIQPTVQQTNPAPQLHGSDVDLAGLAVALPQSHDSRADLPPEHPTARAISRTTVHQMQRQVGNSFVQRRLTQLQSAAGANDIVSVRQDDGVATTPSMMDGLAVQRRPAGVIQRGEPGVHQGIEMGAWNVAKPKLEEDLKRDPSSMTPEQRSAMQVYAGNWMRDFSQFLVPVAINAVSKIPKQPGTPAAGTIGNGGGEALVIGLLRALASLEFGPEITDQLMTGPNIGMYRPEEHMDNPAGMSLGGDVLVRNDQNQLVPADQASPASAEQQLQGSAGIGPQVENANNYNVSGEGLSNHIYNTTEQVKNQFGQAFRAGPTAEGREHFGSGLHGVEDYFSHSNFIEVALNIILRDRKSRVPAELRSLPNTLQGGPVDTLYDKKVTVGDQERQAVTTGTFGALDTRVSVAHALLPRLPALFSSVDQTIDRSLLLLEQDGSNWAEIKAQLMTDRAGQAAAYLIDGMDQSGMQLPAAVIEKWQMPSLPGIIPDPIKQALDGRWIATGIHQEVAAPSTAIPMYKQFYQDAKAIWEYRDSLRSMLQALLRIIPGWALGEEVVNKIRQAIALLEQSFEQLVTQFKTAIKRQVREYLFQLIEGLTGVNVPAEKREVLEQWLAGIHQGVEGMTHQTALEVRQKPGGDLSNLDADSRQRRIPAGALPPSHSEISKDHPPHPDDPKHSVHGPEMEGSLFFEIHRQLATLADQHLGMLIEQAWQSAHPGATLIGTRPREMDSRQRGSLDAEAARASQRGRRLADREHRAFAQRDQAPPANLQPLLDAVDLYISHPADSQWWRSIVQSYIQQQPEDVLDDIKARNQTRADRGS